MVGTGRRAVPPDLLDGVTSQSTVDADSPEATVLAAAAVLGSYRRAGRLPPAWHGDPAPPADPDPRPESSPAATQVLELLLDRNVRIDGGNELLARQWLRACAAANRRVPAALLVTLLQLATTNPELRDVVATVAGPRGTWLAARNRRWSWAVPTAPGDVAARFDTATRAERLALLTALRRTDPDRGRELVESTWHTETAANRGQLLDTLAAGLTDADEPFLESTLDDKAPTVRAAAAALLDRLPDSRRARRMADRLAALTKPDGTVELPDKPDAAGRRDGIAGQREPGYGPRASWLIHIVGAAPLPARPVLDGAPGELVTGWTKAALRRRDRTWLRALAEAGPTPELLGALDADTATRIVAGLTDVNARFAGLLAACPGPWPADFSILVVQLLQTATTDGVLTLVFQSLAEHLDPVALPGVEDWHARTSTDKRARRRTLRGLANALTIRQTIEQEFS